MSDETRRSDAPSTDETAASTDGMSGEVLWGRQETRRLPAATTRSRRVVQGLPDWEPLPPGEITVQRRREA
jgi:hypothetical protein